MVEKRNTVAEVHVDCSSMGVDESEWIMGDEIGFPSVAGTDEPLAEVHVSLGMTKSLGNYECARIDVGIRIPCRVDHAADVFDKAKQWCADRLGLEVKKIVDRKKAKNKGRRS